MFKQALAASALAALAACGGGGSDLGATLTIDVKGLQPPATTLAPLPAKNCKIDLYGDSILAGAYSSNGDVLYLAERPAAILKRLRPAYEVFDHTVPGETAVTRAATFNNEHRTGRFVLFEHGVNDAAGGTAYEPALRGMVEYVKAEGRTPIVTGLSTLRVPLQNVDAYNLIAQKVATETVSAFANWRTVAYDPSDMADDYHPGPKYAQRLVDRIIERLDVLAPECKS